MNPRKLLVAACIFGMSGTALSVPLAPGKIKKHYEDRGIDISEIANCSLCHVSNVPIFNRARNLFGQQIEEELNIKDPEPDFSEIDDLDADEDGVTNLEELTNLTLPGDPDSN